MEVTTEQICQDVMSLLGRFKQEVAMAAEKRHLTSVQMAALYMVDRHGELPMGKVAHVLHCDPSNVTGIVDRLVAHKLVTRQECPTDRRAKTISLTPEGKKVVDEMAEILPMQLGCDKLTDHERSTLHTALQKILA
jgi:DNA-binding MarR family transcriptional regulator